MSVENCSSSSRGTRHANPANSRGTDPRGALIPEGINRRSAPVSFAAATAFAVLLVSPVQGQIATDSTTQLDPVVVTATRLPARLSELASTVTVIQGTSLRERGVRFVLDALREMPGSTVVQSGSFGASTSLFVRGGESDYVKVLIDGVAVNDPGGSYDFAHLSTDNIERIEIVRGPASVLYGSDAVTGVIQIFTRQGSGATQLSAGASAGNLGTVKWNAGASGGTGQLGYAADLSRFSSDGMLDVNNRYANLAGSALVRARPSARNDVALSLRAGDSEFAFPTDFSGAVADSNQFTTRRAVTVAMDGGHRFNSKTELRVQAGLYNTNSGFDDAPDNPGDTAGFAYASARTGQAVRRTIDVRVNYEPASALVLTAGAQLEHEDEEQFSITTSNFGEGVTESAGAFAAERSNRSYYAQAVTRLHANALLTLGARLDDNEVFGAFGTYRAGVSWLLPSRTRLRATVGTAFKAPTFAEQFADNAFEVGNPELQPERSLGWEAGVEQDLFAGSMMLGATGFRQRFSDLIQYSFTSASEPSYFNVARARADGVEATLRLRVLSDLDMGAHATWLRTEVRDAGFSSEPGAAFVDGARLIRRPSRTAGLSLRYHIGALHALGAAVTHTGTRDDVDFREFPSTRVELPAYTLVDLSADFQLLRAGVSRPGVHALLRLENAFDKKYDAVVGFPGLGRVVTVGARTSR